MSHANHRRLLSAKFCILTLLIGAITSITTPQITSAYYSEVEVSAAVCSDGYSTGSFVVTPLLDNSTTSQTSISLTGTANWLTHLQVLRDSTAIAAIALSNVADEPVSLNIPLASGINQLTISSVGGCPEATTQQQLTITSTSPPQAPDTTAPIGSLGSHHSTSRSPALFGTVDDPTAMIVITINGRDYIAINNGNGTWSLPAGAISPELASGTYKITVRFSDQADNTTTMTDTLHINAPGELGFVLAPNTGYLRIGSTNIPSWSIYATLVFMVIMTIALRRQTEKPIEQ